MTTKYDFKQASKDELTLYCYLGEAVCAIQHVEDALSHLIVLKKDTPPTKSEADELLQRHRTFTLGRAINIGNKAELFNRQLQKELNEFLNERNWLIHKSVAQNRVEWDANLTRDTFIKRIKDITLSAQELIQIIESDMIKFAESNGKDMSQVKAEIRKYYAKNE